MNVTGSDQLLMTNVAGSGVETNHQPRVLM